MDNSFNKRKLQIFTISLASIVAIAFVMLSDKSNQESASELNLIQGVSVSIGDTAVRLPQGEIFGVNTLDQSFIGSDDNLTQVRFTIATWARANTSTLNLRITQEGQNNSIYTSNIDTSTLVDGTNYLADFPAVENSKGKVFHILLSSTDAQPGNAVTVWLRKDQPYEEGRLLLGGKESNLTLSFNTYYLK